MTTLPIEDEKDTRLIADMEFANDTTPEEKAVLRKWTKLFEEVRDLRGEITRCEKVLTVIDDDKKALAHADHIQGMKERADKIDAEMKPLWVEYETLRDTAEPVRKEKAERVRELLRSVYLMTAQQIIDDGCTGLFHLFCPKTRVEELDGVQVHPSSMVAGEEGPIAIETVKFIRENMGGARVSLPCYVGPDRYCLIHQTIGGLQIGQKQNHADQVSYISRDLTPEEKGHMNLVENVRRREGTMRDGKAILTGQKIPEDLSIEKLSEESQDFKRQMAEAGASQPSMEALKAEVMLCMRDTKQQATPAPSFTCPEHGEISWACRFCLAQALVNGSLSPEIFLRATIATIEGPGAGSFESTAAGDVSARLEALDASGAHEVKVYAKVASFRRKLAME